MARIPEVTRDLLDEDGRRAWDEVRGERDEPPTSFRSFFNSPGAALGLGRLGGYLRFGSELDPRARELAVIVVNRETGCDYGNAHHVVLARAMGIPDEVVDAVAAGRPAAGLSPVEELAVRAAEETMAGGSASAATVSELVASIGREQAVDLVVSIGYYTMLAQYFRTFGLEVPPDSFDNLTGGRDVALARDLTAR